MKVVRFFPNILSLSDTRLQQINKCNGLPVILLTWVVLFLMTLYAWHQSHFQFQEYWSEPYKSAILFVAIFAVMATAGISLFNTYPYQNLYFISVFFLIVLFYGAINHFYFDAEFLTYSKSAVYLLAMLFVIGSKDNLKRMIVIQYILGMTLIILNSIVIFHWLGILQLDHEQIMRVGGSTNRPDLDPFSFGIFGRTESYVAEGDRVARLQGWSSEPLHWAYFVLLTTSCGLMLLADPDTGGRKHLLIYTGLIVVFVYSYFVKSTTLYLSIIYILFSWLFSRVSRKKPFVRYRKLLMFMLLIIMPGFLIPFVLSLTVSTSEIFNYDVIFHENSNWAGKIEFLNMGTDLFFRPLPSIRDYIPISHNFILDYYLKFGYILILPLLFFLYDFLDTAMNRSPELDLAVIIFIVAITLDIPENLFVPSGAVWLSLLIGARYHFLLFSEKNTI